MAMVPLAVPGLVLGIAYIFFFNHPDNPLNGLVGTMAILVLCTVVHFYTVSHLTQGDRLNGMSCRIPIDVERTYQESPVGEVCDGTAGWSRAELAWVF